MYKLSVEEQENTGLGNKKLYKIRVYDKYSHNCLIEAESLEEAKNLAYKLYDRGLHSRV